jgi:hypothetical protein
MAGRLKPGAEQTLTLLEFLREKRLDE